MRTLLFVPLLGLTIGCGPVITLHHRSAPDASCAADPSTGAGPGVLDVLYDRGYTALVAVSSPVGVTLESATVYADQNGEPVAGMPTSDVRRYSTVGGFVSSETTLVPIRLLTQAEAQVLDVGLVGSRLQTPDDRESINVSTSVFGGGYSSNELTLEVQLCRGCLLGDCIVGELPTGVCFAGQDDGGSCVP
jgi:hypothetical protein